MGEIKFTYTSTGQEAVYKAMKILGVWWFLISVNGRLHLKPFRNLGRLSVHVYMDAQQRFSEGQAK